ncbi:hypothetical protein AB0J90_23690 [Micromonospora sp. NPDC049523]|uniref:hypothetical protein n=1 Tax=Micromonospora sp. NPDC049523 TaxID=3155921 RepID=UPI00343E9F6D
MTSVPAQPAAPPTEASTATGEASTEPLTATGEASTEPLTVTGEASTEPLTVTGEASTGVPTVEVTTGVPTVAISTEGPTVAVTTRPGPTKVRIETPGATIDIEAHEPLGEVVDTALRLFHEAGGWPREQVRSAGFAQTERRDFPPPQSSSMPYAPGAYPVQSP